jgi:hypothetical protein
MTTMTPTKRRRLYIEAKKPQPGDVVVLGWGDGLAAMITLWDAPGHPHRSKGFHSRGEEALLLGLNEHLDYAFVMLHQSGKLGWIKMGSIYQVSLSNRWP